MNVERFRHALTQRRVEWLRVLRAETKVAHVLVRQLIELRAAGSIVARHFPDDRRRWFILRYLGERIEELEAGSETAVCGTCRRYYTYDPGFYWLRGLEAPTHCTSLPISATRAR